MGLVRSVNQHKTTVVHSTPDEATDYLLSWLTSLPLPYNAALLPSVWEPACGSGAITRRIHEHSPGTSIVATDIELRPDVSTAPGPVDFLAYPIPPHGSRARPRAIITNPPFRLATKFIEHGLALIEGTPRGVLALFLPIAALAGQKRHRVLSASPPTTTLVFSERMSIFPDNYVPKENEKTGGIVEYAWFVWLNDAVTGDLLRPVTPQNIPAYVFAPPGTRRAPTHFTPAPKLRPVGRPRRQGTGHATVPRPSGDASPPVQPSLGVSSQTAPGHKPGALSGQQTSRARPTLPPDEDEIAP